MPKQWDIGPPDDGGRKTERPAEKPQIPALDPEREDSFLEPVAPRPSVHRSRGEGWLYLAVAFLAAMFLLLVYIAVRGNRIAPVVIPPPQVTVTTPPAPATPPTGSLPENTTPTPPVPPPVNKADVTIRVLNGNGKTGSAAKVRDILKEAGFTVTSIGNSKTTYQKTTIYYKKDGLSEAKLVQDALADYQTELIEDENLVGSESNLLVVVGQT